MAKYIDSDALLRHLKSRREDFKYSDMSSREIFNEIKGFQGVELAPVPTGHWETVHYGTGFLDGTNFETCSKCGFERVFQDKKFKAVYHYCPNCGTKMIDEETSE